MNKTCNKCKLTKSLEDFAKTYHKRKDGSLGGDGRRSTCRSCDNANRKRCYDNKPITRMFMNAKSRARQYNIEFDLNYEDLVIPEICPILEVKLVLGTANNYEFAPSIDRIDPKLGYIKGNVRVISLLANRMKNSATKEQCEKFSKNILKYYDDIV